MGAGDGFPRTTGELCCEQCGERRYSAAAQQIVLREEPCDACGGRLRHAPRQPLRIELVGVASLLTQISQN
jgi:hypothetical protein